jgi:hypothetical protein
MEIHPQKVQGIAANINTRKENQDHQNNSNGMEDVMLKGHPLSQMSY